jgi:DNA-binding PadR family transcriptional regulator
VAPSTISRAAGRLEKKGLITRDGEGPKRIYRLTAKSEESAKAAAAAILLSGPAVSAQVRTSDPVTPTRTEADLERESELRAEQAAANAP